MIDNYAPNTRRRFNVHTVKLTFMSWEYKAERIVKVRGNCSGLDVIKSAINNVYDSLPDNGDGPEIELTCEKPQNGGETLWVAEEGDGVEFLHDMLVGAEVIAIELDE